MDLDGTVRLLGVILAGAPSLPGTACRGRYELFDEVPGRDPGRHVQRRQRLELAAAVPGLPRAASVPGGAV